MKPNQVRGEATITVGGTDFIVAPTFNRLAKVEAALGRSLVQFIQETQVNQRATISEIVGVLEILAREPKLKTDQIAALVIREGSVNVLAHLVVFLGRVLTGEADDEPKAEGEDGTGEGKGDPGVDAGE